MSIPDNQRVILGLDPGLRTTGWGVVVLSRQRGVYCQASGLIRTPDKDPLPKRLAFLFEAITAVIHEQKPQEAAVEEVFVNKNPETSLKLALARGVVLCAPAVCKLSVAAYTANHIKKSVVGYGHAEKSQIIWIMQRLLNLRTPPEKDAADALAVAVCHLHTRTPYSASA